MSMTYIRLEPCPHERDLDAGFAAALHDPLWFLARQWQMGEHQGENASSPTWLRYALRSRAISASDPRFDPAITPAEAIVESELDDWWTMGRRVRTGRRFVGHPAVAGDATLSFFNPPPPYEQFHDHPDGLRIWQRRAALGLDEVAFGADLPPDSLPAWDAAQLLYQQQAETAFDVDGQPLVVQRHRGGRLDWHSVDAGGDRVGEGLPLEEQEVIPTPLNYPGAPRSRWWEIEDREVDWGGYAPDSAHTATAFLTELIFSHSDDWFLFPVLAQAGRVVAIESVALHDAFGRTYGSLETTAEDTPRWPGLHPPEAWTLFKVDGIAEGDDGLAAEALLLWHVAELPLEGTPLERVQFGLDETSNLLWAVERLVDGREVESRRVKRSESPRFNEGPPSGDAHSPRAYAYVPAQGIGPHWHPYTLNEEEDGPRRLIQRRLADLSRQRPGLMPAPEALVLQPESMGGPPSIAPLAVPSNGIEVERRWLLARDMNGQPVLWIQRQRRALLAPPARLLRFDVMEPAAQKTE